MDSLRGCHRCASFVDLGAAYNRRACVLLNCSVSERALARCSKQMGVRILLYVDSYLVRSCSCIFCSCAFALCYCGLGHVHLEHVLSSCFCVDWFALLPCFGCNTIPRHASRTRHGCEQGVLRVCARALRQVLGYIFVLLRRPFPIVNVIADQSGVASADTAVLQNSRQAERVRASAAAKHIADQREAAKSIASEAAPLLNRLSKLASAASDNLHLQSGHA